MNKLGKILEKVIRASKKSREWRSFVYFLAAVVVFTTTYALILPAITVEKSKTDSVGGLVVEEADQGSMGAGAEASGDVHTAKAQNEAVQVAAAEEVREPYNGEVQTIGDRRVMFLRGEEFDVVVSSDLFSGVSDGTTLSVRGIPDPDVAKSYSDRISDELLKIFVDTKSTEILYRLVFTDEDFFEYTPTGRFDVEFIFHNNTVGSDGEMIYAPRFDGGKVYAAIYDYLTDEMILAEKNGDEYETPVILLDENGVIRSITLKGLDFYEYSDVITLVGGPVNEELKLAAEKAESTPEESPEEAESTPEEFSEETESTPEETTEGTESRTEETTEKTESKTEGSTEKEKTPEESKEAEGSILRARGSDYTVTLTYSEKAEIPDKAVLEVKEVGTDTDAYIEYLEQAKAAAGLDKDLVLPKNQARFFEMRIMADGKEVVPAANVNISIKYDASVVEPDSFAGSHLDTYAVCFGKKEAQAVEVTRADAGSVEFEAESLSVCGVIHTVNFYRELDGKIYEFSMPGGGFVSLEHLVEVLGINKPAADAGDDSDSADSSGDFREAIDLNNMEVGEAAKQLVADVANVEFSSPDLVWVGKADETTTVGSLKKENRLKVEYAAELTKEQTAEIDAETVGAGDWALIGIEPFRSEETLTVTMKSGEQFTVKVTDSQIKKTTISAAGDTWEVTVTYDESAGIPDGAKLKVTEIQPKDRKYQKYYDESAETAGVAAAEDTVPEAENDTDGAVAEKASEDTAAKRSNPAEEHEAFSDLEYARIFNIEIWSGNKKIEPKSEVAVNIKLKDAPEDTAASPKVVHFAGDGPELMEISEKAENTEEEGIRFTTDSFSVYSVLYTVDFKYSVNGKMYQFSLPGGGFVSFTDLVEVLGIIDDTNAGENEDENGSVITENAEENAVEIVGTVDENASNEEAEENGVHSDTNTSLTLGDVVVSDASKKFVADVASVEFSNPELVDVSKVDADTTVGQIKESRGLEVEYSAELTEEQIAEINSSTVEAGDWALISVLPFDTEESLTVTMKNGDKFVVKVTDGQDVTEVAEVDADGFYVLYVDQYRNNAHHYYALRNDGASVPVPNNDLDSLGNEFTWRFGYDGTACWWYNGSNYIEPEWSTVVGDNPGGRYLWIEKRGSGFGIHGNYWSDNYLSWDSSNGFKIVNNGFDVAIKIYEKDKPQLNFSVAVNNPSYGSVSCSNTVTDLEWKNTVPIVATPAEGCYFVGWRRGEEVLTGYDSTIPVGGIEFTQDNQILTAVFAKNYTSPATQEINEWVDSLLGNSLVSDKTAHVLDYDNRIYEVDLTASSSRYTIDQDIRIEFITDISRSMYFPETLLNEQDFTVNGQINLGRWLLDNGDPEEVYYVIGDIDNTATMYAVYFSGNDYFTRWSIIDASYYLPYDNASTSGRIKNVCQISNGNTTVSITDRFADNRIFTGKIYNSTQKPPKDTADWDRLSYLTAAVKAVSRAIYRLDPGAEIGLVTFASAASGGTLYGADDEASLISEINSIQPVGGTNQTSAFNLINNSNPPVFTTNSGKRQVALLITDGAPQGTTWDAIERAAGTTEGNGVEIWTLGLALDRVGNNKSRLMNLASEGGYSGNAEDADQLVAETKKILEEMLVKATVIGEVYDTVDPAFYPIDSSGNPIEEGYYYADTTGGSVTRHLSAPSDVKKAYYHWINDNGTWSIAYYNQEIKWPEDGGWKESFYIKAKEDFMGGNTISTNSGVDNRVEANRVKHSGSPDGYYWLNQDHSSFRVDYETPHVNVDELSMTENSTEWTVYLGTEVDPEKELRELWDKIRVNLVVKKNGMNADTNTVTNGSQMYYSDDLLNDAGSPDGTTNASLPLSHFVNPDLIETLLRQIKNGETMANSDLIYRYFPYGHSIIGTFELSLEKTVNQAAAEDGAPKQHETKEKGQEKEVYTLKVTYTPVGDNASTDYAHTTSGKSAGKVADGYDGTTGNRIDSENVHKIHVFAKDLEIQKKDMTNTNKLIDTAKFKLYRTAKKVIDPETGQETSQYESGTVDLKVGNETKKVVQIGDEMTTSGGKITVEDLSYAPDGVYYLEETKAPDGYIISESPMTIRLTLKDEYRDYKDPKPVITDISNTPYNWTQTVHKLAYANSKDGTGDDEKFVVEVLNNPGVELPSTGGSGTNLFYMIGCILTMLAGAGIVMKRRRRGSE